LEMNFGGRGSQGGAPLSLALGYYRVVPMELFQNAGCGVRPR
jgi:hypothetical protein